MALSANKKWSITLLQSGAVRARAVNASNITAADYYHDERRLIVHFAERSYAYANVGSKVWAAILGTEASPGVAINRLIVQADPGYFYERLDESRRWQDKERATASVG